MKLIERNRNTRVCGFSLIEMMVVIVIVSIVVAAVLAQVNQTQQRATAEQDKLDQIQVARSFVDQIAVDVRQLGYPNSHNFDVLQGAWQNPLKNDVRIAAGLVKLTPNSLRFEGDVDGSGNISVVSYAINGDGNCATCLERAQVLKVNGDPLTGQTNLTNSSYDPAIAGNGAAEIQNVQNANSVGNPIFTAFKSDGTQIALPIDIDNNPALVAQVRVIQISLDVSDPTQLDPQTRQRLEANITSRVQIVNCSMAGSAAALGIAQVAGGIQLVCQP
jgi:prepilin-type N-terminal cleavage/methylation domain-containing protein